MRLALYKNIKGALEQAMSTFITEFEKKKGKKNLLVWIVKQLFSLFFQKNNTNDILQRLLRIRKKIKKLIKNRAFQTRFAYRV